MHEKTQRCLDVLKRSRWGILAVFFLATPSARAAESWSALINPDNSLAFNFIRDGKTVFRTAPMGWGPNWAWVGMHSRQKAKEQRISARVPFASNKGGRIDVSFDAWQSDPRQIAFRYELEATEEVSLTMLAAGVWFEPPGKGTLAFTHVDGKSSKLAVPVKGIHNYKETSKIAFEFEKGGTVEMTIDPPCPIVYDGGARVVLASEKFPKGKRRTTLTLRFPEDTPFYVKDSDLDRFTRKLAEPDWFAFQPSNKVVPGVLDMDEWLDRPAGKHGGVRIDKDRFVFTDGTPIKFWGVNLSYTANAPERAAAELTAARYAKYGVNAVRMHKFTYPKGQMGIGDPNDSTNMDKEGLDRLDYFTAQLKKRGVYFGWSHTYGFRVVPGDRKRLVAYDEIAKNLKGNTYAFIHFAEDVQDLMIEMVVNLLKHRNPYTGQTYADEPALCFLELQNEDDIFFYTSMNALNACPTYKKRFLARFAAWLKKRYGSQEKLVAAWEKALLPNETLEAGNIVPQTNPWFFGSDNLPKTKGGARRRLLDTAAFFHEIQDRFYGRFVKAIREAGYRGPLVGSPWQAPSMLPHYYNLHSDYKVGYIDRHNYFEGDGGDMFASMLTRPGSGYFSSGLQQAIDRPFGLSEWIHVYPNVYGAEGPPIMAVYGMGLQGWDASYEFQSQASSRVFSDIAGRFPWGVWEADVPTSLGQYPALARAIQRGDVKQGEIISVRRVHPADMAEGRFNFSDKVEQRGDVKTFGGSVPQKALAAGRVVVEFTKESQASQLPDMSRYRRGSVVRSTTGQLEWDTSGQGFFTANTAGTKAVVGFARGKELALGNVKIRVDSRFASLFLTSLDRQADLTNCKRALITALARQSNTGFTYFTYENKVRDNGRGPILLEPVKATLAVTGRSIAAVNVLDHDGVRTGRTVPVTDGRFTLDGTKDKAIYYEVLFR